jgi:hypothetical protein
MRIDNHTHGTPTLPEPRDRGGYATFATAYCMGAMAHGATKEEARRELQQAWKDYCGCTT